MRGTLELTPDQLAQLVCGAFQSNGIKADGLALHLQGALVGYDKAVVHIEYQPQNKRSTLDQNELDRMLNPQVNAPSN
jgi:hypothetical protein